MESAPEGDEEGVFDLLQHPTLIICVFDLLHLDHLILLEDLDSIEALVVLGLDKMHSTEAAGSQRPLYVEVGQGVFPLCFPHWIGDGLLVYLTIGKAVFALCRVHDVLDAGNTLLGRGYLLHGWPV